MTFTDEQIIEFGPGMGQRSDGFSFRVLGTDRQPLDADLKVYKSANPQVDGSTSRQTYRTGSGIVVQNPPVDIDLRRARIQPVVKLQNGSEYPQGILMFGLDSRNVTTAGQIWTPELFDENFLLAQDLDRTWSLPVGASVRDFFTRMASEVLEPLGIPWDYSAVSDVGAATPLTYTVGSARLDGLNAMASLMTALPPFFGNDGVHRLKPAPTASSAPDHVYELGGRIFKDSITVADSSYKIPNRFIVVGNNTSGPAIRGVYDLPPDCPNSIAQTGQIITSTHTVAGVASSEIAVQIAYVDALTSKVPFRTCNFAAACDPRHDLFDTFTLLGDLYLESGGTLPYLGGGAHQHAGSRIWG